MSDYVEIVLSQGKVALVDLEDYEKVSKFKWFAHCNHGNWYAVTTLRTDGIKRKSLKMHRLIMGAGEKDPIIDHINGNGLDNRRSCNLRFASPSENARNMLRKPGKTGFTGVVYIKPRQGRGVGGYQAQLSVTSDGKRRNIYLGFFSTPEDAHAAYCAAKAQHHGDFSRMRKPMHDAELDEELAHMPAEETTA